MQLKWGVEVLPTNGNTWGTLSRDVSDRLHAIGRALTGPGARSAAAGVAGLLGLAAILAGVAAVWWPAAAVLAGVVAVGLGPGWRMAGAIVWEGGWNLLEAERAQQEGRSG